MKRLAFLLLAAGLACAQDPPETPPAGPGGPGSGDPMSAATFAGFRLRALGPALMSGRICCVAVHPKDKATWYVGVASGGVWKTTNAGITFQPIFSNEASYSIGSVAIDPKNPETVWVGTGEANNQRALGFGDGVYRSDDGGRTWRNLGLKNSAHIGKILIDPRDSSVVYAAAYGPLWSDGGDRGVYKTTDGGKTWNVMHKISDKTGAADIAMDPFNPDVLLAAFHQRRRHVWTLIHGGPESQVARTTDGGKTWTRVRGILSPNADNGRVGVSFSAARQGLVYAVAEGADTVNGTYRSLDGGVSWNRMSGTVAQAMYYATVFPDPVDPETVYIGNVQTQVSNDGGRTFRAVGDRSKHVDTHWVWIDPADNQHLLIGCDGGLYESYDGGGVYRYFANLSVTQFYNVDVDYASPIYHIYGGTQDNSTLGGPSRARRTDGPQNAEWFIVTGGDGFVARVDPTDPNIIYGESQYGGIVRLDRRTSERVSIKPVEGKGEPRLHFNWEAPFIISPHNHNRLYFGTNRLHRSDDRGDSWRTVSPNLTRQTNRDNLPVMGRIWPPEAIAKHQSTSTFNNITAVTESRKKEGLLYVGSDDGVVSASENGGLDWKRQEKFPNVPDMTYVQRLYASKHDANTVFALFDNHKNGDFKPYLLKSTDRGANWTEIKGDLPERGMALSLAEDHVNPNLLFVGTEFGLYFTVDGGKKWIRLRGNLPTIPVRDLAIQERENDLVLATFGRGFYVLDDYSPLRSVGAEALAKPAQLFPAKKATLYFQETGSGRGFQGEQLFFGENAAFGSTITYWLKDGLQTKRQQRVAADRAASRDGKYQYPAQAQLTAEADEEPPSIILTIADSRGNVVRRLTGPVQRGINRVVWNLRGPSPTLPPAGGTGGFAGPAGGFAGPQGGGGGGRGGRGGGGGAGGGGAGGGGGDDGPGPFGAAGGPWVAPGTYKLSLAKRVDGVVTPLQAETTVTVEAEDTSIKPADRAALAELQVKVTKLQRAVTAANDAITTSRGKLGSMRRAVIEAHSDLKLVDQVTALDKQLLAIQRRMRGDETVRGMESAPEATIQSRVQAVAGALRNRMAAPTGSQKMSYQIASEEFAEIYPKIRQIVEGDIRKLESQLDSLGVPTPAGHLPEWKEK